MRGGSGGGSGGGGVRWVSGWWGLGGFRVDVNAILGVGGDGGCEPNIEGIVQCTKRCCTILRKLKLGFMFMKHYAPNRCEPSIEALNFGGGGGSGQM